MVLFTATTATCVRYTCVCVCDARDAGSNCIRVFVCATHETPVRTALTAGWTASVAIPTQAPFRASCVCELSSSSFADGDCPRLVQTYGGRHALRTPFARFPSRVDDVRMDSKEEDVIEFGRIANFGDNEVGLLESG
ncbi:hypothetical protein QE152_g882 [Popillia japonica]|uniref:Secreted protein n=1 Tax=Popillia japonica TaxID=7064 RepID=A0AAW1NCS0_POPJA